MYTLRIKQKKNKDKNDKPEDEDKPSEKSVSIEEKQLSTSKQERALKIARKLEKSYSEDKINIIDRKKHKYFNSQAFTKIKTQVEYLWSKLKAHETPWQMKLAIFGGFAYMILPVDVIPDSIPGFGLVDDASVLFAIWKTTYPYLKEVSKDIIDEKGTEFIREKINVTMKDMIFRSVFTLCLNIAGTLFVCLLPFGKFISTLIGSLFFLSAFILNLVRTILFWKNNGKLIFGISINIIKEKNISRGISEYIKHADDKVCKAISKVFQIVDITNKIPDAKIPTLEACIRHFIRKLLFQVLLFAGFYGLYMLLIYGILKPTILKIFADIHPVQLLWFPLYVLFNSVKSLFVK